ncbi:MAG: hypothetical protein IJ572_00225 [Bacilli bacterium]|nr:hypothetical protein [Bacilli bacterium]
MKKVFYTIIALIASFVLIGGVSAESITYSTINEAVAEEISIFGSNDNYVAEVEALKNADLSNYKMEDNKVNIYVFRGNSCPHCLDEIVWLANNIDEIGKYANIYTYEVWENKSNSKLMSTVAKKLKTNTSGVPFTVIGDQYYSGFQDSIGQSMLEQVKKLYETSDRYDIKKDINLEDGTIIGENKNTSSSATIILLVVVLIGGIALIYFVSKSK